MTWRTNLLNSIEEIEALIAATQRIAVLGIKTEQQASQPAFYVPRYLQQAGLEVIPVPVYYPAVHEILGVPVFRRVVDIPGPVDLVNVFRRSGDIEGHVDDILTKNPQAVWFQSGIRNDHAANQFARAGIKVVQDRCLMVDHRRVASALLRTPSSNTKE